MNNSSLLGGLHTIAANSVTVPTVLASLLIGNAGGTPIGDFQKITTVIQNVTASIFEVSTALVSLLVIVSGIYLMFNRDTSMSARLEKLSFLKTVLTGYAIIFAGNFLVQIVTTSLQSGGINHG